jgi:antiviral defense system Shedu protein SduA
MPHQNWRDAVAQIQQATSTTTAKQYELAKIARIELPGSLPRLVAAARLQNALSTDLGLGDPAPANAIQHEILEDLRSRDEVDPPPTDRREAEAWIEHLRLKARCRALERLQIEAGDIVKLEGSDDDRVEEISSIGNDGRVYLKGGLGGRAWPDVVTVRARKGETGAAADNLRRVAANQVATRTRTDHWSVAKQSELQEFAVTAVLSSDNVMELEEVINSARDEKPIQQIIETRPQLLTALLGGNLRFCLPRRRLGGEHIPDFLISDVDSLGIRWVLVELETPGSDVTLQSSHELEQRARKGLSQIREWREWLQSNLAYARHSRRDRGLGLSDIRPASAGLVLVGRRDRLHSNADAVRNQIAEDSNIRIHTYDWLLDQLRGTLSFAGPAAANPHALQPHREQ